MCLAAKQLNLSISYINVDHNDAALFVNLTFF